MALTQVGTSQVGVGGGSSGTSAAVPVPAGLSTGDLVIVIGTVFSPADVDTIIPPAGFTAIPGGSIHQTDTDVAGDHSLTGAWYRYITGDSGTWTFTWTHTGFYTFLCDAVRGVTGAPIDAASAQATSFSALGALPAASRTWTGLALAQANEYVILGLFDDQGFGFTASGWTSRQSGAGGTLLDQQFSASGATGSVATVAANPCDQVAIQVSILVTGAPVPPGVSYIGHAEAAAATVNLPSGWAAGDLAVVYAYRNGNVTAPTVPAGWTTISAAAGANTNSRAIGYRVLQAGDTATGTWTNATAIEVIIVRGQAAAAPIGTVASGGTNTTTLTIPALALTNADGTSAVLAFTGSKATNANTVTLSSTNSVGSTQGALNGAVQLSTTAWASRNYSAVVNTLANRSDAVEILAANTWVHLQHNTGHVTATTTPSLAFTTLNTTAGSIFVLLAMTNHIATLSGINDSSGNTWVSLGGFNDTTNGNTYGAWACLNATGGVKQTVGVTTSVSGATDMYLWEFAGASGVFQNGVAAGSNSSARPIIVPSFTAAAGALWLNAGAGFGSITFNSPWSGVTDTFGNGCAYYITPGGATTPNMTDSGSGASSSLVVGLLAVAPPPTVVPIAQAASAALAPVTAPPSPLVPTAQGSAAATVTVGVLGPQAVTPAARAASVATVQVYTPVLVWSGRTWDTRPDATNQQPGPDNWRAGNAYLVSGGVLRLGVTKIGASWYAAELDGRDHLGYGRYRFVVNSDLSALDPNIVLGLFTYDNAAGPSFRELDIETESSSLHGGDGYTATWTVQPGNTEAEVERLAFNSNPPYTCDIVWQSGQVYYTAVDASNNVLHQFLVTENVQAPGNEVVILNLWMVSGTPPAVPLTIDIASFTFTAGVTFTAPAISSHAQVFTSMPPDIYPYGAGAVSGGNLVIPCTSAYPYWDGDHIYSLLGSSLTIQVAGVPAVGTGTTEASLYAYYNASNYVLADVSGGSVLFRKREAGVNTDNFVAYNAGTMVYWRFEESGGNLLFRTSNNGSTWTTQFTVAHTMPTKLSNVRTRLLCGYYGTEVSPGSFSIAVVNPAALGPQALTPTAQAAVAANVQVVAIPKASPTASAASAALVSLTAIGQLAPTAAETSAAAVLTTAATQLVPTVTAASQATTVVLGGVPDLYRDTILAETGLVSYWRLGEGSGNALDWKGPNPGTTIGTGITRNVTSLIGTGIDAAASGDGTGNAYIAVPPGSSGSLDVGAQITVEMWVRPGTLPAHNANVINRGTDRPFYIRHYNAGDGRWEFNVYDTSSNRNTGTVTSPVAQTGIRQYLVMAYDGARFTAYINGVKLVDVAAVLPGAAVLASGTNLLLFNRTVGDASDGFAGTMDEVALYNVALTPAQVLAHYQAALPTLAPAAVASTAASATLTAQAVIATAASSASAAAALAVTAPASLNPAAGAASQATELTTAVTLLAAAVASAASAALAIVVAPVVQHLTPVAGATSAALAPLTAATSFMPAAAGASSATATALATVRLAPTATAASQASNMLVTAAVGVALDKVHVQAQATASITAASLVVPIAQVAQAAAILVTAKVALATATVAATSQASVFVTAPAGLLPGAQAAARAQAQAVVQVQFTPAASTATAARALVTATTSFAPAASAASAVTAPMSAAMRLAPSAGVTTQTGVVLTAPMLLVPNAQARALATGLARYPIPLAPGAASQASATTLTTAASRLAPSASTVTSTSAFATANAQLVPVSATTTVATAGAIATPRPDPTAQAVAATRLLVVASVAFGGNATSATRAVATVTGAATVVLELPLYADVFSNRTYVDVLDPSYSVAVASPRTYADVEDPSTVATAILP